MRLQLNGRFSAVGALVLALAVSVLIAEIVVAYPEGYTHKRTHHMSRRFSDIQCKGVYDSSIFARLDRICVDCYNIYRDHHLHRLCRENCFTTDYFLGCVEALQLTDEVEQYKAWIKQLHGADPSF